MAYKNTNHGAISYAAVDEMRYQNMFLIDNHIGTQMMIGKEGDDLFIYMSSMSYWAEFSGHRDCEEECARAADSECYLDETNFKAAIRLPVFTVCAQTPFALHGRPFNYIDCDASWGGRTLFTDTRFHDFTFPKHYCGNRLNLMEPHPDASDYTPEVKLEDTFFDQVRYHTFVWFYDENPDWAVVEKCGNFACTGLNNIIITFRGVSFADFASQSMYAFAVKDEVAIMSNEQSYYSNIEWGCSLKQRFWNGHYCDTEDLGMLLFAREKLKKAFERELTGLFILTDLPSRRFFLISLA